MDVAELRQATVAERVALAAWLDTLDEGALATPSLCAGWTVKEVAAHLAVAMSGGVPSFLREIARHRGDAHAANRELARRRAERPWPEIVATIRDRAGTRLTNPGTGPGGPFTDTLVHGGDMKHPLGVAHEPAGDRSLAALRFLTGRRAVGFVSRGRLRGLRLVATDVEFASGTGAEVTGRASDLMMAAAGRAAVLPELSGPGVDVLRKRLTSSA